MTSQPLAVAPTGEYFAFVHDRGLYVMPLDGTPTQFVSSVDQCGQQTCEVIEDLAVAHHGRQLVWSGAVRPQAGDVFNSTAYSFSVAIDGGGAITTQLEQALALPNVIWHQLNFTSDDARVFGVQYSSSSSSAKAHVERAARDLAQIGRTVELGVEYGYDRMAPLRGGVTGR